MEMEIVILSDISPTKVSITFSLICGSREDQNKTTKAIEIKEKSLERWKSKENRGREEGG
jgi:hypothetical protein